MVGERYAQKVEELRERIQEGVVTCVSTPGKTYCFFCRKPIEKQRETVIEKSLSSNGVRIDSRYSSHPTCYAETKGISLIK
ncbi:MAG: hypothetical protein KKF68_00625 [Nanoarchaeota archaeon]|nr:hypothetical protein [Nanoarchaeota archaeon]